MALLYYYNWNERFGQPMTPLTYDDPWWSDGSCVRMQISILSCFRWENILPLLIGTLIPLTFQKTNLRRVPLFFGTLAIIYGVIT